MTGADYGDYVATVAPMPEFFEDAFKLAEKVGGELGLTSIGRLVITLPPGGPSAQVVSASISGEDFPHCYVEPGTDTHLVFAL